MKYSYSFFPEKRNGITQNVPVTLSVTYSKQRMLYYTGLRCNIDIDPKKSQWDAVEGKMKRNQVAGNGDNLTQSFNSELTRISGAVDDLFKVYEVAGSAPAPAILRNDLKRKLGKEINAKDREDFFSRFDKYIRFADLSDSRKITMLSIQSKLKTFNPDITFESLNVEEFKKYLRDTGLNDNSIIMLLTGLKTFIKEAIKKKYTDAEPFKDFKIGSEEYGDPIYLSIEERDLLFNADLTDPNLALIRDIFCLQCFLGCRYGDLMRFTKENINDGALQYIATKTKKHKQIKARVRLVDKAILILSRYDLSDGRLVPYVKTPNFNYYIKQVFKAAGLIRSVTFKDEKTKIDTHKPINELASSHMARRIFIGGLYEKNVKNEIIASMSGHVADSKSFARYRHINEKIQDAAMKLIE